jgi:AraC-like DNA-binding protein
MGRGVRAARLHAIKSEILREVSNNALSLGDIARRKGISAAYARQLFADEGTTFTDFLLDHRLALAHRMLTDSRRMDRPISQIAYDCGFGDLSYFNRTFRRRYQAKPSDVRNAARNRTY